MKNKIKKLKLPLNKMTGNEKDYTAVLLEDVSSNMKAFWEVLSGTQGDVKELKEGMEFLKDTVADNGIEIAELKAEAMKTNKKLDSIESQQEITNKRLDSIEFKLDDLTREISFIKEEIRALKISLSAKADKEKLNILEFKIIKIEKYLKLA